MFFLVAPTVVGVSKITFVRTQRAKKDSKVPTHTGKPAVTTTCGDVSFYRGDYLDDNSALASASTWSAGYDGVMFVAKVPVSSKTSLLVATWKLSSSSGSGHVASLKLPGCSAAAAVGLNVTCAASSKLLTLALSPFSVEAAGASKHKLATMNGGVLKFMLGDSLCFEKHVNVKGAACSLLRGKI